jgi:hypothetical protein
MDQEEATYQGFSQTIFHLEDQDHANKDLAILRGPIPYVFDLIA